MQITENLSEVDPFFTCSEEFTVFTTARKSGNILLTYFKDFFVRHSSEYENVGQ